MYTRKLWYSIDAGSVALAIERASAHAGWTGTSARTAAVMVPAPMPGEDGSESVHISVNRPWKKILRRKRTLGDGDCGCETADGGDDGLVLRLVNGERRTVKGERPTAHGLEAGVKG